MIATPTPSGNPAASAAAGRTPLLRVRGLSVALPDFSAPRGWIGLSRTPLRTILHDVDLDVSRGECLGLVGESGSGKTTLGRTLLRLVEPTAGRIELDGRDIAHDTETTLRPVRARMQMIFQDPLSSLNPRRTVGDAVVQPLRAYGRLGTRAEARQAAATLLEQVALPAAFAARYPHELSGGQRQRVGIARAIALGPDLVVADEIVSGLDVSTQATILLLLRELRARLGLAIVFITHDLSVVRVLCDRIAVMRDGRIVEQGATAAVFAAPQDAYTRELLDAVPLPDVEPAWLDPPDRLETAKNNEEKRTMQVEGSVALVTGANRGLGREIVQALLAAGASKVYAAARHPSAVADLTGAGGGRVVPIALDITDDAQVADAARRCTDVTLLVNNAGINHNAAFLAAPGLDAARQEIATNYFGPLAMCRAFAPVLKANAAAGGAIVNVLSILAKATLPMMGSLCASKAAALRMTEGVRAELAAQGTLVVAVMTGALDTDMSRDFQGPKSSPVEVAQAIVAALGHGDEEVYVGPMPEWVNGAMKSDPKALEKELAKALPAQPAG